jgi:hypothetical protein
LVVEILEAQDLVAQETTEVLDTEDHATTETLDIAAQEMTEAQDLVAQETTEVLDTEDHATTETLDIAAQEMTEAQDLVAQETTEVLDTIKVNLDSKEIELQFTEETILEQQDTKQIVMNLIKKILVIVIHFILLLGPNYLLYSEKKNAPIVALMMNVH